MSDRNFHVKRIKEGQTLPTRHFSRAQEESVAKATDGRVQPNSGATSFAKGDVKQDDVLIECKCKTKDSDSISVKREWIEKNEKEALFMGKPYSAVAISFGDGKNHYIISEEMFQILLGRLHRNANDD